jgi:hypothetical protein
LEANFNQEVKNRKKALDKLPKLTVKELLELDRADAKRKTKVT